MDVHLEMTQQLLTVSGSDIPSSLCVEILRSGSLLLPVQIHQVHIKLLHTNVLPHQCARKRGERAAWHMCVTVSDPHSFEVQLLSHTLRLVELIVHRK